MQNLLNHYCDYSVVKMMMVIGRGKEIRLALSKFIAEKNELKSISIESAMYLTITDLINEIPKDEDNSKFEIDEFTNEQIRSKLKKMDGMDIRAELLYSIDLGAISHKRMTSLQIQF